MRYMFANCILDTGSYSLLRDGASIPVEPQVLDLLLLLAENAGNLVTKDTLIDKVWDGRIVSEATISARISAARTAVGDNGKKQAIVKTIPRKGFRLEATVSVEGQKPSAPVKTVRQTIQFATSTDGTKIAYAKSGEGPLILRVGHFLTHLEMDWLNPIWRPYIDALSADNTFVRYDQRGTGLSDTDVSDFCLDSYVADLLAVANAIGEEKFPLIATSQGVPIAIKFAADYPERVSHLVLYGGYAQGRAIRDDSFSNDELNALVTMIRAGWGNPDSAFMVAFTSLFCPGATKAELEGLVEIQHASATPRTAAKIRVAIEQMDVTGYLKRVNVPTLVIHANNDAVQPASQGRAIAAGIPRAEFHQIETNNHIPLPSDPVWEEIVSAQLEFISRKPLAD
ncbi:MAG: alpha/beta fold hydrolase [Hyphomicrobiales bacterium]